MTRTAKDELEQELGNITVSNSNTNDLNDIDETPGSEDSSSIWDNAIESSTDSDYTHSHRDASLQKKREFDNILRMHAESEKHRIMQRELTSGLTFESTPNSNHQETSLENSLDRMNQWWIEMFKKTMKNSSERWTDDLFNQRLNQGFESKQCQDRSECSTETSVEQKSQLIDDQSVVPIEEMTDCLINDPMFNSTADGTTESTTDGTTESTTDSDKSATKNPYDTDPVSITTKGLGCFPWENDSTNHSTNESTDDSPDIPYMMNNPERLKESIGIFLLKSSIKQNVWMKALDERNLSGYNLSGADLSRQNFSHYILIGTNFSASTLEWTDFTGAFINAGNFIDAKAQHTIFDGAEMNGAKFQRCYCTGVSFINTQLIDANFTKAITNSLKLITTNLKGVDFTGAKLINAHLDNPNLESVNFTGTDIRFARVTNTDFVGADLSTAQVGEIQFTDTCNRMGIVWPNSLLAKSHTIQCN
jgi:uncharacterized protein YjbI with pentapeptide repeats